MAHPAEQTRPAAKKSRPRPPMEGLAARQAAVDILRLVRNGRPLDEALATCRSFAALEGPDRGFARAVATAALRRQGSLDEVIDHFLKEPLKPGQHEVRTILRVAAAQLLLLETPAHAAVATAVEMTKARAETKGYRGLVNALCRRMSERGAEVLAEVGARTDTPGWLWRRLERTYGPKVVRAMAKAHRTEPPLDISVKAESTRAALAEALTAVAIGPMTLRRTGGGRVEELPGYDEGQWWVQDVAATLPARLLGDVAGRSVVDLCAAPGGKTMQLAAAGADVTALDISPHRLDRLEQNLKRTGLTALVREMDILKWAPDAPVDAVLLDAPCTATGTIRRNPDLLWNKREEEVDRLAALQDRMIDQALGYLKPGGTLVFATCSLLPEEGEKRIDAALERHPGLQRVKITPEEVGGLPVISPDGDLRCLPSLLPEQGGMDGFFASRLVKAG